MQKRDNTDLPLATKATMLIEKYGTTALSSVIKKDKETSAVYSLYNIPYTAHKTAPLRQFDWHCPHFAVASPQKSALPTLFYMHGGSWSAADKSIFSIVAKEFAEQGLIVINLNYRLMPQATLSEIFGDTMDCLHFCIENAEMFGIDKNQIFLGGDSAGAHLSSLMASRISTQTKPLDYRILGCILFYGVYDISHLHRLNFRTCRAIGRFWEESRATDSADLEKFYHDYSPIRLVTPEFPATFITAGEVDSLTKTETIPFVHKLNSLNIDCDALVFPKNRRDARHAFINLNNRARREALIRAFDFVRRKISTPLRKATAKTPATR